MIVMKFGGSSVGDADCIRRAHGIVAERLDKSPIIVVSAAAGVTDLLLSSARKAVSRQNGVDALVDSITKPHTELLTALGLDANLLDAEFSELREVFHGIHLLGELSPRTSDYAMSFGERFSAKTVAAFFTAQGTSSTAVMGWDAGLVTDSSHTCAEVLPETYSGITLPTGAVPVVTGFIAKSASGEITTLGRGGSDYTAAIIGSALGAEEIQIWTDVDGVLTTDPRLVGAAKRLDAIGFDEASELSYFGARVLHPKSIWPAVKKSIPVRVLNTFNPSNPGTAILPEAKAEREFTAIAFKRGVTVVRIASTRMLLAHGFLAKIFEAFEKHAISVDLVSTSEVSVSMTLDNTENLDAAIAELEQYGTVEVKDGMAVVCVVGRHKTGTSGRIFSICGDSQIPIKMISLGASRINLSFVVPGDDLEKCVKVLHKELFE
ncbi:aspartate kinase [archaeon]